MKIIPFKLYNKNFESIEDILCNIKFLKKKKGDSYIEYSNISSSFDIETSSFYDKDEKRSCMYAWVFGINGKTILGRTWEEFINITKILVEKYKLNTNRRFVIYVHNLSFEFQFFRKLFNWDQVFATDNRKVVYACTDDGIEFRCSYILSGYSLDTVSKHLLKYPVRKLKGDLDYSLVRHSTTPLTEQEKQYIINDGLVVMSYIQELFETYGNITRLPLTQTGFVRKLVKNATLIKNINRSNYKSMIRSLSITPDEYKQLRRAYSGGFTHSNAFYVNYTTKKVSSFDFTSSYPAVLVAEKYPMSRGKLVNVKTKEQLEYYIENFCCCFDCVFKNIESKILFEHYISYSKCWKIENSEVDNGRIVNASLLGITLTEIDYKLIKLLYKYDSIKIFNFTIYVKGYLPTAFISEILKLYKSKTELKGIEGSEAEYMHSKELLNSCYGMCVTDPAKERYIYDNDLWQKDVENYDLNEIIDKYNKSKNRFIFYAWGIWCTAYARKNLFSGILEFKNEYLYSDTDSIKVINVENHLKYFEEYNKNIEIKMQEALKHHNLPIDLYKPKTIKGVEKILGVWDYEGVYDRFKVLGAKRYLTEKDNDINITIAGVNKESGKKYLLYKFKNNDEIFKNFTFDLDFPAEYMNGNEKCSATGKNTLSYLDYETSGTVIDFLGNKNTYKELSSIHFEACDYTMSIAKEFWQYLFGLKKNTIY